MQKTLEHRLAWMAGIVDGEGAITCWVAVGHQRSDRSTGKQLHFCLVIGNTDYSMIQELASICEAVGVKTNIVLLQPKAENVKRHKPCWKLSVHGQDRVESILQVLNPFLINKKERAQHLIEMIQHRRGQGKSKLEHDHATLRAISKLRVMNSRGPAQVVEGNA